MVDDLASAEQQMLKARPWDVAEDESIWEITGVYPAGRGTFTACLAMTLPGWVTGSETPLFKLLGTVVEADDALVDPAWITHARPLLLVHRDEPGTAYWREDQQWVDSGGSR